MNSVILIGRLTRDPELNYTPQNVACTHFTLAVDRPRREGQDQGADFIRVTVFGRQAETCDRYLSKGRQAAVNGRIQTGSYKNRDGQTVYTTDVIAERVDFLGGGQDQQSQGYTRPEPQQGYGRQEQPRRLENPAMPPQTQTSLHQPTVFDDLPSGFQTVDDGIPF